MLLGGTAPGPGLGSPIELHGREAGGLLDLFGIGKALLGKRIAAKESPPALLEGEPKSIALWFTSIALAKLLKPKDSRSFPSIARRKS